MKAVVLETMMAWIVSSRQEKPELMRSLISWATLAHRWIIGAETLFVTYLRAAGGDAAPTRPTRPSAPNHTSDSGGQ